MKSSGWIIVLAVATTCVCGAGWEPPEHPNGQQILDEAREDAQAKRYDTALAKHVWFHEHILEYEPSMYGVRLSYALSDWHRLAEAYPPAMVKLKATRDATAERVRQKADHRAFHDLVSINDTLGEQAKTVELYREILEKDEAAARRLHNLAQRALIRAKDYQLALRYVDPPKAYVSMVRSFQMDREMAKNPRFGQSMLEYAEQAFTHDVSTLVALLVVNDRAEEAEKIAARAKAYWDDADFAAAVDKALKGQVPETWP
ncbi:hypothetical protein HED60_22885 [Planctomycetales bacterium ZRK34]|nr:hypothetical protein HED60_22885 [Planctomycetales bacterium ZRK34]